MKGCFAAYRVNSTLTSLERNIVANSTQTSVVPLNSSEIASTTTSAKTSAWTRMHVNQHKEHAEVWVRGGPGSHFGTHFCGDAIDGDASVCLTCALVADPLQPRAVPPRYAVTSPNSIIAHSFKAPGIRICRLIVCQGILEVRWQLHPLRIWLFTGCSGIQAERHPWQATHAAPPLSPCYRGISKPHAVIC